MKYMFFNLPEESIVYGNIANNDYYNEQVCSETAEINLMNARKSYTWQPHEPWQNFLISDSRKRIKTTFSQISSMLPKHMQ